LRAPQTLKGRYIKVLLHYITHDLCLHTEYLSVRLLVRRVGSGALHQGVPRQMNWQKYYALAAALAVQRGTNTIIYQDISTALVDATNDLSIWLA